MYVKVIFAKTIVSI